MWYLIREAEFKYNLRGKNNGDKIQSIFDAFKLIQDASDIEFNNNEFLKDDGNSSSDSSSNEDY